MRTAAYLTGLFVVAAAVGDVKAGEDAKGTTSQPAAPAVPAGKTAEAEAVRGLLQPFIKAFNSGDAKAIGAMYTADAHVIDSAGDIVEGRDAIEEEYASLFKENPGLTIVVEPGSIRPIGENAVIEDGVNRLIPKDGGTPVVSRYTVVFVKQDGKWLQASVRESPAAALTPHERLKDLEWLLGEWVDEAHDSRTLSTVRWSSDKNYLIREFNIKGPGREPMSGTQRIGWDPNTGQIKSWVFDSEGGHGEALWARFGNDWVIKLTAVLQDGRVATATNFLSQEGKDACRWRTVDRTIGGQLIPVADEFVMVRRPPAPAAK